MGVLSKYTSADISLTAELNFSLEEFKDKFNEVMVSYVLNEVKGYILKVLGARFSAGKSPIGTTWAPTKLDNKMSKLTKSGALKGSFEYSVVGDELMVYTTVKYAKVQHFGATYVTTGKQARFLWGNIFRETRYKGSPPKKGYNIKVPARPFMGFNPSMIESIRKLIVKHIKTAENLGK